MGGGEGLGGGKALQKLTLYDMSGEEERGLEGRIESFSSDVFEGLLDSHHEQRRVSRLHCNASFF